jgi:hypothetical protein
LGEAMRAARRAVVQALQVHGLKRLPPSRRVFFLALAHEALGLE